MKIIWAIIFCMETDNLRLELDQLKQDINFHNYRYHVLDDPVISDAEFDKLLVRLRVIEERHPEWVTSDSPSQRAGGRILEKFTKVRHPASILSLANAFNETDIRAWYERICKLDNRVSKTGFILEPKIDGLTVVLHYLNGFFMQGATRGDGEVGEDITSNLRTVKPVPLRIPIGNKDVVPPAELVVRGEIFINKNDFEKLNKILEEAGERTYQNPRNTAAGSLRQLDPTLTASRPLTLLCYAIVACSEKVPATQLQTLEYLKVLGFPVTSQFELCADLDSVLERIPAWQGKRDALPFEADGVVIKINDLDLAAELGVVGKDPRGAIALKYPAREVTTRLNDIGINVGRTGVLTPTAMLEPVEIGGVTVKQATLHNFDYIAEKDIRIGDRVMVKRAGDVIPYIIGPIIEVRTGQEKAFEPPKVCPACGQAVEHLPDEVAWFCVNAACPAQLIRNLEHFVSRSAMDIVGLGIKIVEQLAQEKLVKDVADLYYLNKKDLLNLEGFAEKKAENVIQSINQSRQQPLSRVIAALGIRGVGEVLANDLSRHFVEIGKLSQATVEVLQTIEGVGPNIASAIVDWFARPANRLVLVKLKKAGVWPQALTAEIGIAQTLCDKTFVVTGTLAGFSREGVKEYIQTHGGKVTDSISRSTDYLVAGEAPGSKLDKARQWHIPVIDEAGLRKLAGD
jgi:DNA ligase (NAD+)